jgi:hypothetical protein
MLDGGHDCHLRHVIAATLEVFDEAIEESMDLERHLALSSVQSVSTQSQARIPGNMGEL